MKESEIRDFLSQNLDIVESGLTLLEKEYRLPNSNGTSGRVDLLARDAHGILVIIELKRSNSSGRHALHELMKYLALFQRERGMPAERMRCVLVSTEWKELLVPFSEHVATSPFSIQGRELTFDESGMPCRTTKVMPLPPHVTLRTQDELLWLTFADSNSRDEVASYLVDMLRALGVRNQVLVKCASRNPETLQFPIGLIVPLYPFSREEILSIFSSATYPVSLLEDFAETDVTNDPIEAARAAATNSLQSVIACLEGVGEATFVPTEGFSSEFAQWSLTEVLRRGPAVEDSLLLRDEDILAELAGIRGTNDYQFIGTADFEHRMQFQSFQENLQTKLRRYGWWEPAEATILAARRRSAVMLSARAFCPSLDLQRIACFLNSGDEQYLPSFVLEITDRDSSWRLSGRTAWDGETSPSNLDELLPDLGTSLNLLRLVSDNGELGERLAAALGFVFPVLAEGRLSQSCLLLGTWAERYPEAVNDLRTRLGPFLGP